MAVKKNNNTNGSFHIALASLNNLTITTKIKKLIISVKTN